MREVHFSAAGYEGDAALDRASGGIAAGVRPVRELGNLPPNICNPAYLCDQAHELYRHYPDIGVEVLRAEMETLERWAPCWRWRPASDNAPKPSGRQRTARAAAASPVSSSARASPSDTGGIDIAGCRQWKK